MKITLPTRSGSLTVKGSPLAVLHLLWASLPLIFASRKRAEAMVQEAVRLAEQRGLTVRRWRS